MPTKEKTLTLVDLIDPRDKNTLITRTSSKKWVRDLRIGDTVWIYQSGHRTVGNPEKCIVSPNYEKHMRYDPSGCGCVCPTHGSHIPPVRLSVLHVQGRNKPLGSATVDLRRDLSADDLDQRSLTVDIAEIFQTEGEAYQSWVNETYGKKAAWNTGHCTPMEGAEKELRTAKQHYDHGTESAKATLENAKDRFKDAQKEHKEKVAGIKKREKRLRALGVVFPESST